MTTLREAAQMALDALEYYQHRNLEWDYADEHAIEALRAALAQPEQEPVATLFGSLPVYDVPPKQEPVAWVETLENAQPHCVTDLNYLSVAQHERGEHLKYIPLYTAPQRASSEAPQRGTEWQGLTEDEVEQIFRLQQSMSPAGWPLPHGMARAIEAKLKQKNNA